MDGARKTGVFFQNQRCSMDDESLGYDWKWRQYDSIFDQFNGANGMDGTRNRGVLHQRKRRLLEWTSDGGGGVWRKYHCD